jgi:hypothetical protein
MRVLTGHASDVRRLLHDARHDRLGHPARATALVDDEDAFVASARGRGRPRGVGYPADVDDVDADAVGLESARDETICLPA